MPSPRPLTAALQDAWWVYLAAFATVAGLVLVATRGEDLLLYAAIGAAAGLALLSVLGTDRMGTLLLAGAYFTAPMYKGLAPSVASVVTPTDLLFCVGFLLLVPRLVGRSVRFPLSYLTGLAAVFLTGLVASSTSDSPVGSYVALAFWMLVMGALPVAIALWHPSSRTVDLLVWCFVAGQIASFFAGMVLGYQAQGRQAGMATHPNLLAQGGMLAIALLLYLVHRHHTNKLAVLAVLVAGGICTASIVMSGSRAATVVVAVLILMIPVVERSALAGFAMAWGISLFLVALPVIIDWAGPGSSIARLGTNDASARASDSIREVGLREGVDRFFEHPFLGTGFVDLFEIHINYLEVAVAIGIFGLAGYLLVLYSFARPLFGSNPYRRLCYGVWAYIGFGMTVPSLYDRSIWAVVALGVLAMTGATPGREAPAAAGEGARPALGAGSSSGSPSLSAHPSLQPVRRHT